MKNGQTKVASLDHEYIVCLEVGLTIQQATHTNFMSNLGWSEPSLIYVHSKFKDLKYLGFGGTNFQTMWTFSCNREMSFKLSHEQVEAKEV